MSDAFQRPPLGRDLRPAPCPYPVFEGYVSAPAHDTDFKFREYWNIVLKRRWTIAAVVIIVVTLSAFAPFRPKPVYEATSRIAIFRETPISLGKDTRSDNDDDYSV